MALDLKRSVIGRELGTHTVDPNTTFQAGNVMEYEADANGNARITKHDGTGVPCGVAKWDKASSLYGVVVAESVVLPVEVVTALANANVSTEKVMDVTDTTEYTITTDYLMNLTNGTIARVASGAIGDGDTVLVTYTHQLTEAQIDQTGRNFNNTSDDTAGSDRITVIQGFSTIYTDQYDTGAVYVIGGTLYGDANGEFTSTSSGNEEIGKCVSVPTATDPWLGIEGTLGY